MSIQDQAQLQALSSYALLQLIIFPPFHRSPSHPSRNKTRQNCSPSRNKTRQYHHVSGIGPPLSEKRLFHNHSSRT